MPHQPQRPRQTTTERTIIDLLAVVRRHLAADADARTWAIMRRDTIRAITWPARWLSARGVCLPQERYVHLISEQIRLIARHRRQPHSGWLPTYLLTCFQRWVQHHAEELLDEARSIDHIVTRLMGAVQPTSDPARADTEPLAAVHALMSRARRRLPRRRPSNQLDLL